MKWPAESDVHSLAWSRVRAADERDAQYPGVQAGADAGWGGLGRLGSFKREKRLLGGISVQQFKGLTETEHYDLWCSMSSMSSISALYLNLGVVGGSLSCVSPLSLTPSLFSLLGRPLSKTFLEPRWLQENPMPITQCFRRFIHDNTPICTSSL